jgi:hypothetical protein
MQYPGTYIELMERLGMPVSRPTDPLSDSTLVYPPVGFRPWSICEVGNDDAFGFYWPIGLETREPVVALMSHDCWTINPIASSMNGLVRQGMCRELQSLLETGQYPDDEDDDVREDGCENRDDESHPTIAERLKADGRSPYLLAANADAALARNDLEQAESLYLASVDILPEYTAAHFGLVMLYRRLRRPDQAFKWMLETIRSPLCFCGASFWSDTSLSTGYLSRHDFRRKCLMWLQQVRGEQASELADDPLFQARSQLSFATGVKTNDDFAIYESAVDGYVEQGRFGEAIRLTMLYGELMTSETTSFRERCGFTLHGFRGRLLRLFNAANLGARAQLLRDSG